MSRKKLPTTADDKRRAYLTPGAPGAKLISNAEAVKARGQHTRPCQDCPFTRESLPGWTGEAGVTEWIRRAHGEAVVECHTLHGAQCAGIAIYRANVAKHCRTDEALRLRPDTVTVFESPAEFIEHHTKG